VPDAALKQKNIRLHVAFLDYYLARQIVAQLHSFVINQLWRSKY